MKQLFLLAMMAFTLSNSGFAKIWRVNNNVGVTADFTSAQQAHDAAAVLAGDTLYFEHSAASYGNLIMTKGLKLIGLGAFLSQNPGLQYSLNSSYLGNITLRPTATNTLISVNCLNISDTADNLTVMRCQAGVVTFEGAKNGTVGNCFLGGVVFNVRFIGAPNCQVFGCSGMFLYNNIINGPVGQQALAYLPQQYGGCGTEWVMPHSVVAGNNTINGGMSITGYAYNNIFNSLNTDGGTIVTNNIFISPQSGSFRTVFLPGTNSSSSIIESGNSNQFGIPLANIIASSPGSIDTLWRLKANSPALGAGTSGTDCGATGGSNPYRFGAQPAIPTVYKLNVAPVPTGNTIGVTISTRSNN